MGIVFIYARVMIFILAFILLLSLIGKRITNSNKFPFVLMIGYITYTAIQALIGIAIQVMRLDRTYYFICISLLWLGFLMFARKSIAFDIKVICKSIGAHIKTYGFLYAIAGILVIFAITNIEGLWTGNRLDDGAYLTQIAQSSKLGDLYDLNLVTGYPAPYSFIRSVNTFELEADFYAVLFHIPVSIYLKVVLPFINYFLFVTAVYYLAYMLLHENHKAALCISSCVLLFGLTTTMLQSDGYLVLTDDWQFNWAMGYGSSVVRVLSYFLIFLPILNRKLEISPKHILYFILVSITLFSKATQALPVLYLAGAAYLLIWIHKTFDIKKQFIIFIMIAIVLMLIPPYAALFEARFDLVYLIFADNFGRHLKVIVALLSIFILLMLIPQLKKQRPYMVLLFVLLSLPMQNVLLIAIILFIYGFTIDHTLMKRWNYILLVIGLLMFVPKLNTLFIDLSIYSFVASRAITLFAITLICTSFIYLYYMISQIQKRELINCGIMISIAICFVGYYGMQYNQSYGITRALKVVKQNPLLVPQSTIDLQHFLQSLAEQQDTQLDVIMPVMVYMNSTPHFPYVLLRMETTDVRSLSAKLRYPDIDMTHPLASYSQDDQDVLEAINGMQTIDQELIDQFQNVLNQYSDIDIIVVQNPFAVNVLIEYVDLKLVGEIKILEPASSYYVLQR